MANNSQNATSIYPLLSLLTTQRWTHNRVTIECYFLRIHAFTLPSSALFVFLRDRQLIHVLLGH